MELVWLSKMKRKKEKSLKPSMREKKRYLLIENAGKEKVEKAILDYIGILGWGKVAPVFVKKNVLAVNRGGVVEVKASLELAKIKVKKVSGTLRGVTKK